MHSNTARLAPKGAGLIHCARYLAPDEAPARDVLRKDGTVGAPVRAVGD